MQQAGGAAAAPLTAACRRCTTRLQLQGFRLTLRAREDSGLDVDALAVHHALAVHPLLQFFVLHSTHISVSSNVNAENMDPPKPLWDTAVAVCLASGMRANAQEVLDRMRAAGVSPDDATFAAAVTVSARYTVVRFHASPPAPMYVGKVRFYAVAVVSPDDATFAAAVTASARYVGKGGFMRNRQRQVRKNSAIFCPTTSALLRKRAVALIARPVPEDESPMLLTRHFYDAALSTACFTRCRRRCRHHHCRHCRHRRCCRNPCPLSPPPLHSPVPMFRRAAAAQGRQTVARAARAGGARRGRRRAARAQRRRERRGGGGGVARRCGSGAGRRFTGFAERPWRFWSPASHSGALRMSCNGAGPRAHSAAVSAAAAAEAWRDAADAAQSAVAQWQRSVRRGGRGAGREGEPPVFWKRAPRIGTLTMSFDGGGGRRGGCGGRGGVARRCGRGADRRRAGQQRRAMGTCDEC
ncbi:hypothetical protein JKP88DRAFT_253067 [Tribonema minus]|uniref:Pentatricopeptide repeat-containing protein n=1 Tax=Tribonema minus TaxID=303371 RepID=A0A836CL07_9STRA|nr:hypothetical protein JKP88DRAFT_253067 [Tribonema minus]